MGVVFSHDSVGSFIEKVIANNEDASSSTRGLSWPADVEVDWNGCRKFKRLPPTGQHPRLFFTAEELPRIIARFTHSSLAPQLKSLLRNCRDGFLNQKDVSNFRNVSPDERRSPTAKETVDTFFKADEARNMFVLGAYVYGIIFEEPETARRAKEYAVFYAKVILRARKLAMQENIRTNPYNVWHNRDWTVPIQFLFGGTAYALLYDLLYNELEDGERTIIQTAIKMAIQDRAPWGMNWPSRRIQSNWAAYHGDFYTLSAVVEGEDNSNIASKNMSGFADLMVNFLDYAVYDSGHPIEDAYAVNLALREGSLCFIAMARRGHNVFNHPHYKSIWTKWLPYALEPNNSGKIYGGSSGNDWKYPTSAIIAKYMFPRDATVDHVYRHFMCENGRHYSRLSRIQCRLSALAFAIPSTSLELDAKEPLENLNIPDDYICRNRGKMVMRSDWSKDALWFTFDARPDAFLIGHDTCSRGAFVLNAGGRSWGHCPEWKWFRRSSDYSTPMIDNLGQDLKAPSVKLLQTNSEKGASFACADLTYAYNWAWTEWARSGQDHRKMGYEIDPSDPRDFGFNAWWGPHSLHGEHDIGFAGLHVWRRKINEVKRVTRSAMLVRGRKPFVVIADDVEKGDENEHEYVWAMTTPSDVQLDSFDGQRATLVEYGSLESRKLIIQNVSEDKMELSCKFRRIERRDKTPPGIEANQIRFFCHAQKACFRFVIYCIRNEDEGQLHCSWTQGASETEDERVLKVEDDELKESFRIRFSSADEEQCKAPIMSLLNE